jgi:hypothetical protein
MTISSGMEESLEVEEIVDTTLSLSLMVGAGIRQPPVVQALLPASPPPENKASTVAGMKRKGRRRTVGSTTTTWQHGKRTKTVHGGSCVVDGGVMDGAFDNQHTSL